MMVGHKIGIAAILAGFLAGCATQQYHSAPVVPAATASAFEARTLLDPGLRSFAENSAKHAVSEWPPADWNYQTLSLAALYFNPKLESARARAQESQAALETAGARPNPTFGVTPGIPSPYLLTLDLSFPIETAGKRRYRIQAARSLGEAGRYDLADTAWSIRTAVRSALVDYLVAGRALELLRCEAKGREEQLAVLAQMASSGEIPRLEVDPARNELSKARAALGAAEEQAVETKAALAAAIGVPEAAIEQVRISWPDMDSPPSAESLSLHDIERDAILNRLDVRRALAQYAASEADLQLEIAKQYPDFNIGPGYSYEEKQSYFTVGLSATIPLFDRNQGPIAQAEARRREAAAAFAETQAEVILKSERALNVYGAALKALSEAGRFVDLQASQREAMRQWVQAGEHDRLELDEMQIQNSVAARARLDALAHAQRTLGDLEDAVQRPLVPGDELPR